MSAADTPSPLSLGEIAGLLWGESEDHENGPGYRHKLRRAASTLEGLAAVMRTMPEPPASDPLMPHEKRKRQSHVFDREAGLFVRRLRAVVGTGAEGGKGDG